MTADPILVGEIIAKIVPELDPETRQRYTVIRTRYTEDREQIPQGLRIAVYKRDHFRCVWCGSRSRLELDHIHPWSAGGTDDFDNLRTLCHGCNTHRSNYANPLDDACRRLPSGYQCVQCNYNRIAGEPDISAIYCRTCQAKSAGLPGSEAAPTWYEDEEIA